MIPRAHASTVLALLAFAAVVATLVAYASLLQSQAEGLGGQPTSLIDALRGAPAWFLLVLAASALATLISIWLPSGRPRRLLLCVVAGVLTGTGVVAIFSVGAALFIAAGLSWAAAFTGSAVIDHGPHPVQR